MKDDSKVTQREMVLNGLQELGADAKPQALIEFIKTKYATDLSPQLISNYKSVIKKKGNKTPGKPGRKPGRPAKVKPSENGTPVAAASTAGGGSIRMEDLTALRALVKKHGAGQVKSLVDIVG